MLCLGGNGNKFPLALRIGIVIDIPYICGLATKTRAVINNLTVYLFRGVMDK
jgi:hypothetical protein